MKKETWKLEKEFDEKFNIAYVRDKGWAFLKEEVKSFFSEKTIDKQILKESIENTEWCVSCNKCGKARQDLKERLL